MRTLALTLSVLAGLCSFASHAAADDAGTFQVLGTSPSHGTATMDAGTTYLPVIPVGIGPGWRGWGWYPSASRPVAPYYGTANQVYGYTPTPVRAFNYYQRGPQSKVHHH